MITIQQLLFSISLAVLCNINQAGRILVTHSMAGGSHILNMQKIAKLLATEGGHHVTFLRNNILYSVNHSAIDNVTSIPKLKVRIIEEEATTKTFNQVLGRQGPYADLYGLWNVSTLTWSDADKIMQVSLALCHSFLKQHQMWSELAQESFDLVLMDDTVSHCIHGFVAHYIKAPVVAYSCLWHPLLAAEQGVPFPPSYSHMLINLFDADIREPGMVNRAKNWMNFWLESYVIPYYIVHRPSFNMLHSYLGYVPDIKNKYSLVFVNSHWFLEQTKPTSPNIIMIGGMLCEDPKPLEQDFEQIMESDGVTGSAGVIYMSFGTMITTKMMGKRIVDFFLDVFEEIPEYRILWKIKEPPTWRVPPDNVRFLSWVPSQEDILGDNRTKVFIFQAGTLAMMEAIYHATPMLVFPIMGDQFLSANMLVDAGLALMLPKNNLQIQDMVHALKALATEDRYQETSLRASQIMRHQPVPLKQQFLHWCEHVMMFAGTDYLRIKSDKLTTWQQLNLDLLALLALLASLITLGLVLYHK